MTSIKAEYLLKIYFILWLNNINEEKSKFDLWFELKPVAGMIIQKEIYFFSYTQHMNVKELFYSIKEAERVTRGETYLITISKFELKWINNLNFFHIECIVGYVMWTAVSRLHNIVSMTIRYSLLYLLYYIQCLICGAKEWSWITSTCHDVWPHSFHFLFRILYCMYDYAFFYQRKNKRNTSCGDWNWNFWNLLYFFSQERSS